MVVWKLPPPSRVSSEGGGGDGVSTEKLPPPSRVSSEGGGGDGGSGVSTEETPLRLVFRAREGVVMVVVVCRQKETPLRLTFQVREGW